MKKLLSAFFISLLIVMSSGLNSLPQTFAQPVPVPGGTGSGGVIGDTVYRNSLSSNVQLPTGENAIPLVFTQKIRFTLNYSMLPSNWDSDWVVNSAPGVLNCDAPVKSQFNEILNCQASATEFGQVLVFAKNNLQPDQVSNTIAATVSSPYEGFFMACLNPPQNYMPATCNDRYENGQWNRNAQFRCKDGYQVSGKQCVLSSNVRPNITENCYVNENYTSNNRVIVSLLDEQTSKASDRCEALGWNIQIRSGSSNAIREIRQDSKMIEIEIFERAEILVEAAETNYSVGKILNVSPSITTSNSSNPVFRASVNQDSSVSTTVGSTFTLELDYVDPDNVTAGYGYGSTLMQDPEILTCTSNMTFVPSYTCRANSVGTSRVYFDISIPLPSGDLKLKSNDVRVRVSSSSTTSSPNNPPNNPSPNNPPPAGYEDKVRTNYQPSENPFSDTSVTSSVGIAAAELYRRAVIGGFADGTFRADQPVNRAEAAKFLMLARKQGSTTRNSASTMNFWDIIEGEWYYQYVIDAAQAGIINGNPDGSFRPADTINRAEFMKMLTLAFDLPVGLPHTYTDANDYPNAWFWQNAGAAQKYEVFPGRTALEPTQEVTRGEVAIAIYQYLKNRE